MGMGASIGDLLAAAAVCVYGQGRSDSPLCRTYAGSLVWVVD